MGNKAAEPTASDVHVDAPVETPPGSKKERKLARKLAKKAARLAAEAADQAVADDVEDDDETPPRDTGTTEKGDDDPADADGDQDEDDAATVATAKVSERLKAVKQPDKASEKPFGGKKAAPFGQDDADAGQDDDDAAGADEEFSEDPAAAPDLPVTPKQDEPKAKFDSKLAYLSKLHQHLKDAVDPEVYAKAQAKARGHAGGATPRKAGEIADLCALRMTADGRPVRKDDGYRLFYEFPQTFSDAAPEWIPYLPKPGVHKHPDYGPVSMTKDRLAKFVKNFNDGIYQSQVPLDLEHETKLGGAAAWVKELRTANDGHVEARVDWTARGEKAMSEDLFRYISPEWYDEWQDPLTGKKYTDVVIGGALTTRPFFKEKSLPALVASERGLEILGDKTIELVSDTRPTTTNKDKKHKEMADTNIPAEVSPKAFAELEDRADKAEKQNRKFRETIDEQASEIKKYSERVTALEKTNRTRRFSDVIANGGQPWFGDAETHMGQLETLSVAFGEAEDSPYAKYVETQKQATEAIRKGGLFSEAGRGGSRPSATKSAVDEVTQAADALMASEGTAKSDPAARAEAMNRVFAERPELFDLYRAETAIKVG